MVSQKTISGLISILVIGFSMCELITLFNPATNNNSVPAVVVSIQSSDFSHNPSLTNEELSQLESYLIITVNAYKTELEKLARWKEQKGLPTYIKTVGEIIGEYTGVDLPEKIRNCIQDYYQHYTTRWVLLGGDTEEVPTRMVDIDEGWDDPYTEGLVGCDGYYADLDNDWNNSWGLDYNTWDVSPEIYVGRLTANSEVEMQSLIENILTYEKNPTVGEWMDEALFAGSTIVYDEDWNNDSIKDYNRSDLNHFNNFMAEKLLPEYMNATFLGETQGLQPTQYHYDLSLTKENLSAEIEEGATFGLIEGHANPTRQVHTVFVTDYDDDGLMDRNGSYYDLPDAPLIDQWQHQNILLNTDEFSPLNDALGLYILFGCSAGTFDYYEGDTEYNCLSEMMLKNTSIGCIAGWNLVWEDYEWYERDHGGWYMEGMSFRIFEQLLMDNRQGKALYDAKHELVKDRQNPALYDYSPFIASEEKLIKQLNLLGDPEVSIWLGQPASISYSIQHDGEYFIEITSDGSPLNNVIVTVTNETNLIGRIQSNQNGEVEIPRDWLNLDNFTLTITHQSYLPIIRNIQSFHEINTDFNYNFLPLEISFSPDYAGYIYVDDLFTVYWPDYTIDNLLSNWYFLDDISIVFPSALSPNLIQVSNDQYTFQDLPLGTHYIALMFENSTARYYTDSILVEVRESPPVIPGYSPYILLGVSIITLWQFIRKKDR